jgi:hypothetical protein
MPLHNQFYLTAEGKMQSGPLMQLGPQLKVEVRVPKAFEDLLVQQGKPVPKAIAGMALFDSGASISAVDDSVITSLGVQPVGITTVHTPSGSAEQNQYPVRFSFPETSLPELHVHQAIGSFLQAQGLTALIGRDALSSLVFIYNGPLGLVTLAL